MPALKTKLQCSTFLLKLNSIIRSSDANAKRRMRDDPFLLSFHLHPNPNRPTTPYFQPRLKMGIAFAFIFITITAAIGAIVDVEADRQETMQHNK